MTTIGLDAGLAGIDCPAGIFWIYGQRNCREKEISGIYHEYQGVINERSSSQI